jgi:RND family efflux transporter MFP subunit
MSDEIHDPAREAPEPYRPVKVGRALLCLVVAAAALAVTGVVGRSRDEDSLAHWTKEQAIPTVALVAPQRGGGARELVLPGNVDAFYTAAIHSQVSGYVREWRKDIGAIVKRGDVLAVVDTPELDQSITVAESDLAKAKANMALANVTAERWDSLRSSAAVSQQAADEKDADARARAAEVDAAAASLERLKAQKAFSNIVAPFDGVVTARNVDVGALVKSDADSGAPLFTVSDIHKMRIYVPVPETYSAEIKDGMTASLELPEYPDRKFAATVATTSHAIDKKARVLTVELLADNADGALSPGSFARVHFELPPDKQTIRIPASALLYRNNQIEVGVVDPEGHVTLKAVRIARDLGDEVEISSGLNESERVVVNPPDSINPGETVRIMDAQADAPATAGASRAAEAAPGNHRETMAQSDQGRHE